MPFTSNDFVIENRDVAYEGVFRIVRNRVRYRLFNGEWGQSVLREVMERKSAVAVLLYDADRDQVVLIEQFRIGAIKDRNSPWLIEIVAGIFDHDETPTEVATRESKEEANCEVLELIPICNYFVSPGGCDEYLHLYCGRIVIDRDEGVYGLLEEHEDIRAFAVDFAEAYSWIATGKIITSPAIVALQWLQINREKIKSLCQKTPE